MQTTPINKSDCEKWQTVDSAPIRKNVIVGDPKRQAVGAGYRDRSGQWYAYSANTPMETPTHWMPFPDPPKL
jgi:hypothetical protein